MIWRSLSLSEVIAEALGKLLTPFGDPSEPLFP